ncbi:MAG: peptidoglycan-binding protein [bacterium]|nr:peptidoglycan-binding protein [bacterium]
MLKKLALPVLGILFLATPALATTNPIEELQSQIQGLLAQITQLKAQMAAMKTAPSNPTGAGTCPMITRNLIIGSTDSLHDDEVSRLQQFLTDQGVYTGPITGYYGNLTAQAVMRWQKAHGMGFVTPKSGVGPMTRAKITESCGSGSTSNSTLDPVIYSVTPSSGPIGTKITIKGKNLRGFEGDLNARIATEFNPPDYSSGVMYGDRTGSDDTTIVTTIQSSFCKQDTSYSGLPCASYFSVSPGVYEISVKPWSKWSNSVSFTVTESSQNGITVLSPIPGDRWKTGEAHIIKLSEPVIATWPEGDKVVLNLIREDGSQAGIVGSLNNGSQAEFSGWTASITLNYLGAGTINKENTVVPGRYKIRISRGMDTLAESGVFTISN